MPSLLDKSFVYHSAASHSDAQAFRDRMQKYAERVGAEIAEAEAQRARFWKPAGGTGTAYAVVKP